MKSKVFVDELNDATTKNPVSSSQFGFVENSTLFNTTLGDISTALGVTGTIQTKGAGDAVAILTTPSAGENYIAGIEVGAGITAQTSPDGGVKISTSLINTAVTGAGIIKDNSASSIAMRRIVGGDGIVVEQSTDTIEISQATGATSGKTVIINEVSDFPTAVGGVISLNGDTDYLITTDLSLSDRFLLPNNSDVVIRAADNRVVTLTYTGSGDMFTYTNPKATIKNINISCTSGTFLNASASTTGDITIFNSVINADTLGTITNLSLTMQAVGITNIVTTGFSFSGAIPSLQVIAMNVSDIQAGTLFDLDGATFDVLNLNKRNAIG